MIRKNPSGHLPVIAQSAFIDPTAIICGRVIIKDNVFVGPYAVIRADEIDANGHMEPITIGNNCNVQDGVVIHSVGGAAVTIGENCSIAHRSIIHGPCRIGNNVFIGFNSVVFRTHIDNHCIVRHNAVIDGVDIAPGSHVPPLSRLETAEDLSTIQPRSDKHKQFSRSVLAANKRLASAYNKMELNSSPLD